ncbi:MAG TPA: prepilin-type N-terminal cleavage/methylation domain-containing protein [Longimicrobium sp.]|jgi:prepilin-type N-terminal cleavage/methylation domain-containing protein
MRRRDGFTLIELIVVIAIMGIMLSVSVAALGRTFGTETTPAGIVGELASEARLQAARREEPIRATLLSDGSYRLASARTDSVIGEGKLAIQGVQPSPWSATFFPLGTSTRSDLRIRLDDSWHTVRLDPVTGSVQTVEQARTTRLITGREATEAQRRSSLCASTSSSLANAPALLLNRFAPYGTSIRAGYPPQSPAFPSPG